MEARVRAHLGSKQQVGHVTLAKRCRREGRTEAKGAAAAAAGHAAAGVVDTGRGEVADRHALVVHACQVTEAATHYTHRFC